MSRFLSLFSVFLMVFLMAPALISCTTTGTTVTPPVQTSNASQKLVNLGNSMMNAGDINAALGFFEKAASSDPLNEDVAVTYAKNLMLYDINGAVDYLSSATQDIQSPRLYNWYGVALDLNADHTMAQKIYQKGLDLDTSNLSLMNNLGLSLAVTKQTDNARALFDRVIDLAPDNSLYYKNKAIATIIGGNLEQAKTDLSTILPPADIAALIDQYSGTNATPLELIRMINGL